jgi:hypothetical protein
MNGRVQPLRSRRSFLGSGLGLMAATALSLRSSAVAEGLDAGERSIVLVTTDGLRWQDLFRGADPALMNAKPGGVADLAALRAAFERDTPEQRRQALMPFFWGTIAKSGVVVGNRDAGSRARVTNGKNFSYPGYNELLTGAADPRINSNDKRVNPNENVLEWLNRRPGFAGRVAAFGAWDVFPYILAEQRSGVPVTAGWEPIAAPDLSEREKAINDLIATTHKIWPVECYDSFTFEAALEHLRRRKPRVLYIAFGETDEFAHEGRYDHYLNAAHRFDASLKTLWGTIQAMPELRDRTSLVITTDHGRGEAPDGWRSHNANVPGSDAIWVAAMGPFTPGTGVIKDGPEHTQGQVAATVAALLGLDFTADHPGAARPIASMIEKP